MKAFLFGAGSSYGTLEHYDERPPISKDFGVFLSRLNDFPWNYSNLARAAIHIEQQLRNVGLEDLWTCLDYYAKLNGFDGTLPIQDWLLPAISELKQRALLQLYGRRCDRVADLLPDSDEYTLRYLLKNRVDTGDVVVSFNYDTVIERLAKRLGLTLRHCSGAPRGFVKFVKPHGSASWPLRALNASLIDGEPLLDSLAENFGNDPLLLGAVPIKSELLREVQFVHEVPEVFRVIMHHWRGVVEAIRDAEELIVVGYAFPKQDQYGGFLFREAKRLRIETGFHKIEFYNRTAESGNAILEIFGHKDTEVVWRGPVTCACELCRVNWC
jgi:hypothetical protein